MHVTTKKNLCHKEVSNAINGECIILFYLNKIYTLKLLDAPLDIYMLRSQTWQLRVVGSTLHMV